MSDSRADVEDPAVNGQWVDQQNAWWQQDADWWAGFATEMATGHNPADRKGAAS
jgi:hypothetical protein